jgi:hypothetical protein
MEMDCRNKNRGYQQLRVWQDAIEETGDWIDSLIIKESNVAYG